MANTSSLLELFSQRGQSIEEPHIGDPKRSAEIISFIYGFPDPDSLPADEVIESTKAALERDGRWALQYGSTAGAPPFLDALREKLQRDQKIEIGPNSILVTSGGSQAIQLMLDLFVDWGDMVIVESPTWMGFLWALKNLGGDATGVAMDEFGMIPDALEQTINDLKAAGKPPKLIYAMPNFQNPTGVSMPLERREQILDVAVRTGTPLLEDDAYHDLRFSGDSLPTIYSLDTSGLVIYISTLSKTMGAGMRLGWLVADPEIVRRLEVLKIDGGTNIFGSYVAADWLPKHLPDHVGELKVLYADRKKHMVEALTRYMPEGTNWTNPDGGYFVWLTLPEGVNATTLLPQARELGVEYLPGSTCFPDADHTNTIRLSFSFTSNEQIDKGISILADIVKGEMLEQQSTSS